jgi:PAS domain S-box-containing protein
VDLSDIVDYHAAGEILERISDGFVALDRDWRYIYVNAHAAAMFGRDRASLVGKHIWTEFPEGVGQPFHLAYERAMREQVTLTLEEYYPPYARWFENRIYPSPGGIAIFFTDITERKTAEHERTQLLARLEAQAADLERQVRDRTAAIELQRQRAAELAELHLVATQRSQLQSVLDELVSTAVRALPADHGFAVVWDAGDPGFALGASTLPTGSVEDLIAAAGQPGSVSRRVRETGGAVILPDLSATPREGRPRFAVLADALAIAAVPIQGTGGLLGALAVVSGAPREFGPDEILFLDALAERVAAAAPQVRLY